MFTKKKKREGEPWVNASYTEVQKYYTEGEYFDRLRKRLEKELRKTYDKEVVQDIFKYIDNGKLKIVNPEAFFNDDIVFEDPSATIFGNVKSIDRYFRELIVEIKRREGAYANDIRLIGFLVSVAYILDDLSKSNMKTTNIHTLMDCFVLSLVKLQEIRTGKLEIFVLDRALIEEFTKDESFPYDQYYLAYKMLLNAYDRLSKTNQGLSLKFPRIKLVHAVFPIELRRRLKNLQHLLGLSKSFLIKALKNIQAYDSSSNELNVIADYLIAKSNKDVTHEEVMKIFDYKQLSKSLMVCYNYGNTMQLKYSSKNSDENTEKKTRVKNIYVRLESFSELLQKAHSEVIVKIGKVKANDTEWRTLLEYAHAINLVRMRYLKEIKNTVSRITISELKSYSEDLIRQMHEKRASLETTYGNKIVMPVFYENRGTPTIRRAVERRYIRIISDIHADINEGRGYNFAFSNDFVVCCGDISGNAKESAEWLKNNIEHGVFVHGNHLGYSAMADGDLIEKPSTINNQIKYLSNEFKDNPNIHYLNNTWYEYDGIVFVGTCLYTDFSLYGKEKQDKYMNYAERSMNDFVYPRILDGKGTRRVTAMDHVRMHEKAKKFLWDITKKFSDKPIVIVTHHQPLPFSIGNEFIGSPLNPAFVNDMRDLINARPNIRVWAAGHVHTPCDYVYNKTRIICVPFGYYNENNVNLPRYYGTKVSTHVMRSDEAWEQSLKDNKVKKFTDEDLDEFV